MWHMKETSPSNAGKTYATFEQAREFVRALQLKSRKEWFSIIIVPPGTGKGRDSKV